MLPGLLPALLPKVGRPLTREPRPRAPERRQSVGPAASNGFANCGVRVVLAAHPDLRFFLNLRSFAIIWLQSFDPFMVAASLWVPQSQMQGHWMSAAGFGRTGWGVSVMW